MYVQGSLEHYNTISSVCNYLTNDDEYSRACHDVVIPFVDFFPLEQVG